MEENVHNTPNRSCDENFNNSTGRKSMDQENCASSAGVAKSSKNPLRSLVGKVVFLDLSNAGKLLGRVRECLGLIDVVS